MSKKRPPIEQLRQAGKIAREMLVKKGLIAEDSILDKIVQDQHAPKLPGIPAYLPHEWTLRAAQRIMRDFLVLWVDKCEKNPVKAEDITEFFKFVVSELRRQESEFEKEVIAMPKAVKAMKDVPVLKDVFSPMRKQETAKAIQRFFIDSFAVAIVLKNNHTTSEYANWFLDWTQELYTFWVRPEDREKPKQNAPH